MSWGCSRAQGSSPTLKGGWETDTDASTRKETQAVFLTTGRRRLHGEVGEWNAGNQNREWEGSISCSTHGVSQGMGPEGWWEMRLWHTQGQVIQSPGHIQITGWGWVTGASEGPSTGEDQVKLCKVTLTLTWRLGWKGKTEGRETIKELLQPSWWEMKEVGAWRELSSALVKQNEASGEFFIRHCLSKDKQLVRWERQKE